MILAYLNTYNRHDSTLTMAILSIINQTRKPDVLIVWDDNKEFKDPREIEKFSYLLRLCEEKGIQWYWNPGQKKGAHYNHEQSNLNQLGCDLAWFIDDDCVAEPSCLEELLKEMKDGVGAVGGLIMQPPVMSLPKNADNKIDNLHLPNLQWFKWKGEPKEVGHIYSSFLYRTNIVHHDLRLSSVVFRGETMFTHSLFLMGYKLIVTPKAITWHFQSTGGIHSDQKEINWRHDDLIFDNWLKFKKTGKKIYVLDGGLGDHYMFLQAVPLDKESIYAVCYPELFEGYETISIAEAEKLVDKKDYNVYGWCINNQWKGTLIGAYKKLYENMYK